MCFSTHRAWAGLASVLIASAIVHASAGSAAPQGAGGLPDDCADAVEIFLGETEFTNEGATTDGPSPCSQIGADLWYDFTAPFTGPIVITTCDSQFDTVLALYEGCQCPVDEATLVSCNDDADCNGNGKPEVQSTITTEIVEGQCYKLQVGGFLGAQGTGVITIRPPVLNDDCDDAIEVFAGPTAFTTIGATTDGPDACETGMGADAWFDYVAEFTGRATISTCGSDFDTVLAVYRGCTCPVDLEALVDCNDDGCPGAAGGTPSEVTIQVVAGTCYKIQVGGANGVEGEGVLTIIETPAPPNDECENAEELFVGDSPFTTMDATTDGPGFCGPGEPPPVIGSDVWYTYVAQDIPGSLIRISVCDSDFETSVAIFPCDPCPPEQAFTCEINPCGEGEIVISDFAPGECFLIQVAGVDGVQGNGTIGIDQFTPPIPGNECDLCRTIIEGQFANETLADNTGDVDDTSCGTIDDVIDEWWCYTASADGLATVTTCTELVADFEHTLSVFDACPQTVEIGCSEGGPLCDPTAEVTWQVTANTTYFIRVGTTAALAGPYELFLSLASLCPDLDGSGVVDFGDIVALLAAWGPCGGCPEDLNADGTVDFADVLIILSTWGQVCEQ